MQVAYEEFGERKVFDLVEGGGEVPVTGAGRANYALRPTEKKKDDVRAFFVLGANRAEYVRLYTQYLLVDSVATQSDAFLRGFESVCGGEAIQPSPHISPTSPHTSPHLPTPPRISPYRRSSSSGGRSSSCCCAARQISTSRRWSG